MNHDEKDLELDIPDTYTYSELLEVALMFGIVTKRDLELLAIEKKK